MKTLKIAIVALTLTVFLGVQQAKAQNHVASGLIIGTAVGSIVGLIVASEIDRNNHPGAYVYHQPAHVYHPPVRYAQPPVRHYGNWHHPRHYNRVVEKRRNVVVFRDNHRITRKSVRTVKRVRW